MLWRHFVACWLLDMVLKLLFTLYTEPQHFLSYHPFFILNGFTLLRAHQILNVYTLHNLTG